MPLDGPMDMTGIGNAARASKPKASKQLRDFSVKRGDNGGVIVCETYKSQAPAGRRAGASYPDSHDYTENPFSPDDGAAAAAHVKGLLSQMGITAAEPAAPSPPPSPSPAPSVARGPNVGAVRGPSGGAFAAMGEDY